MGYNSAVFKDYDYLDSNSNLVDMSGEKISSAPELTYSIVSNYSHELSKNLQLLLSIEHDFRSEYKNLVTERDPFFINDARKLTNLRFGINYSSLSVNLWISNIFDEEYTTLKTQDLVLNLKREIWGAPRTVGIRISYKILK